MTYPRRWFVALLTSLFILQMGSAITTIALPVFVVDRYGVTGELGVVIALRLLPMVLAGGAAAWALSRFDARWLAILSTVATGLLTAAIPLTTSMFALNLVSMSAGFVGMFGAPALMAMRMKVIPKSEAVKGNGLLVAAERTPALLGPAVSAGALLVVGVDKLLYAEALATIVAAVVMLTLPRLSLDGDDAERIGLLALLNIRKLWHLVGGSPRVGGYLVTGFFYTAAVSAGSIALIALASTVFESSGSSFAWMLGSMAFGAVIGGLGSSRFPQRSLGLIYLVGNVVEGTIWIFVGFSPNLVLACGLLFFAGVLESVATTAFFADIQLRLPALTVGRLFAFYVPMTTATAMLGALIGGILIATGEPWVGTMAVGALIALPFIPFIRVFLSKGDSEVSAPA